MVTHSWHEGSISSEFLGELSKKVPYRLTLPSLLAVHPCVSHISCQEDEVKRLDEVILGNLIDDEVAEGSKGSHIPEDCDV